MFPRRADSVSSHLIPRFPPVAGRLALSSSSALLLNREFDCVDCVALSSLCSIHGFVVIAVLTPTLPSNRPELLSLSLHLRLRIALPARPRW